MYRTRFVRIVVLIVAFFLTLGLSEREVQAFEIKDSVVKASEDSLPGFHMTRSPLVAVLLSAAIPGGGQVYLGQAWKLPIIYGLFGGFLYGVLIQNYRYHYISDSVNNQYARHNLLDSLRAQVYTDNREFYRDDRDKWWIYLGLAYVANILDAYISAHLFDFDVSEPGESPAKIEQYYDPYDSHWRTQLQIRF